MNISLIGMAGVGKSVVGRALAKRLSYEFIDTDSVIEKITKLKLQKIIDRYGDKELLKIEERIILGLQPGQNCVISPGGSAVYSKKVMKFLKKHSIVVFLDASFEIINSWIRDRSTRGIINLKKKGLRKLFTERRPLYKKYADLTVRLSKNSKIPDVVRRIITKTYHIQEDLNR